MYRANCDRTSCDRSQFTLTQCSNIGVPTAAEVKACLGSTLAQIFFEYSHDDTRKLLNLKEPLKSMKRCLPENEHLQRGALGFPTNNEMIKIDVHRNILEIGDSILERVRREIQEELREGIEKKSQEKFLLYQAKKRFEAKQTAIELHSKYENYIRTVQDELQGQLEAEWENAAAVCAKNTQKAVVQERMNVTHAMMRKMRTEMAYVVESLYKDFEESFRAQKENIIADFNQIIREKCVKLNKEKQEFERRVEQDLSIQRHQLEMQNAADVIYVLCLERLRSCREKHTMHKYFQRQIEGFQELLSRLNDVMAVMREEILNCHRNNKLLGEKLCDVTKQFQKFINFVLHAVPGQADYLLPQELQRLISSERIEEQKQ